jgi:hypothetical protein
LFRSSDLGELSIVTIFLTTFYRSHSGIEWFRGEYTDQRSCGPELPVVLVDCHLRLQSESAPGARAAEDRSQAGGSPRIHIADWLGAADAFVDLKTLPGHVI